MLFVPVKEEYAKMQNKLEYHLRRKINNTLGKYLLKN